MSYSDFTLYEIKDKFSLSLHEKVSLFADVQEYQTSEHLKETLRIHVPLAISINTEKARSELIVAPILVEIVKLTNYKISLFSGTDFNVDSSRGLNGVCDFIISLSSEQLFLDTPIITIVEAKNDNINSGFGQCISEMVAARLFNDKRNNPVENIYGVVTTGSLWKFLKLHDDWVWIDRDEYHISSPNKLIGVLLDMVNSSKSG